MGKYTPFLGFILFIVVFSQDYVPVTAQPRNQREYPPQRPRPCEQGSCIPATGNLLIGREKQLYASSTCGVSRQERYCIVSHLEDRKKCFWCDTRPETRNEPALNHEISNIVYRFFPGTRQKSWWQSENGKENVTIQLDLEAEFHFTHLIIVFKTFRPAALLIERSYDFGKTWKVYRYFAHNCDQVFPGVPKAGTERLSEVVCESRYSTVAPSTGGEVIFRVLPAHVPIDNPYKEEVQNLIKMTNLRINFTKLHTLGDDLLDNRQEIQEKYYYAITDMVVRGSCSCYGHADQCLPLPGVERKQDMVHGQCQCSHNTKGRNCEQCEDFYNDLPWKPAIGKQINACRRCNCNNHAISCHFDAAVYEQSGRVSGGICDDCQHNTMGPNCEMCKPYFYLDPDRDIQDPEACRPCDCDPHGSLDNGICDSRTDPHNGQEAGSCHCKANVDGRRCDTCKNGYWNFTESNPDGCDPCTCNILGTIDNQGCDIQTGECTCKRYVTGRDCNQCLPEYWGLSEKQDGCQPCDCDPGGSLDNHCDVLTGQCKCREHVQGRTCNQPKQQYFTPLLDFYVYEAELARTSENCQVIIREPFRDGRNLTWTGTGFLRVYENSRVEFNVDNIRSPMEYDIAIRYEPQLAGDWDEVVVTVVRPEPLDPNGPCANSRPEDDIKRVSLVQGSRSVVVFPPACLEPDKSYKIILDFKRYNAEVDTPSSSILIDSIVLIPRIDNIQFFRGSPTAENRRQEYERYHCGEGFRSVIRGPIPDICKKYHNSIGFYVYEGAYNCQCNATGSTSKICKEFGGKCECKPLVVGRKCDRCAPGTYGFGPSGCKPCDCTGVGSYDNFCDVGSGQCKCKPFTYGRQCDQCQPGFWNFPNCQRCECNGHADTCDPKTGACINCRDSTFGHGCEHCVNGYYGDPRIGYDIPCRPCPCPRPIGTGHSYAERCSLDPRTKDVVCECKEGYAGSRCDVCSDNYYGHPETAGGSCQECDCNNNIDITRPGNCDPHTGKCLQCLFNTEGDNCEMCKEGFYGDAISQSCIMCVCDYLGTDQNIRVCNRTTGQCPCLKNVVGLMCDRCKENHWKIASGLGCEPCDCDPIGSVSEQCNEYEGQCICKPGFGGRQCNQCTENHWGNPNIECHPCDCDQAGSEVLQCNRENGSCVCRTGISGAKCNQCARGFFGDAPYCTPCGECFTNWDLILDERKEQTQRIVEEAGKIKQVGATGAYTLEFDNMNKTLKRVKDILDNTTIGTLDLERIDSARNNIRNKVSETEKTVNDVDKKLNLATESITVERINLDQLQKQIDSLNNKADDLRNHARDLQEANVELALKVTQDARRNVLDLERQMEETKLPLAEAERSCSATEKYVARAKQDQTYDDNNDNINLILNDINALRSNITFLNEHICDKRGDPCDSICGGAGCEKCGGSSCDEGAVTKVEKAFQLANEARDLIKNNEIKAEELLRNLSQIITDTFDARKKVEHAFSRAKQVNLTTSQYLADIQETIEDIQNQLSNATASPSDVLTIVEKTKALEISLEPKNITDLAERINRTVTSISDIDRILSATKNNIDLAKSLQEDADGAKQDATGILDTVARVEKALSDAQEAQEKAKLAINKTNSNITSAENVFREIAVVSNEAQAKANDSVIQVESLQHRLKSLQTSFLKNNRGAQEVQLQAGQVLDEANQAKEEAEELQAKYSEANSTLAQKAQHSQNIRQRAQDLHIRATKLSVNITDKLTYLTSLSTESNSKEQQLKELSAVIDGLNNIMNTHLTLIRSRSSQYRSCMT